jgi:hypothetical protein
MWWRRAGLSNGRGDGAADRLEPPPERQILEIEADPDRLHPAPRAVPARRYRRACGAC